MSHLASILPLASIQMGNETLRPIEIALVVAFLVLSLGVHEAAHAWTAWRCGDPTARDLGRITLNPFAHIDLFYTIILPIMCYMLMGFPFGGAKPVPVDFARLGHGKNAIVAAAGPLSNVLLAALFFLVHKVVVGEIGLWEVGTVGENVLAAVIFVNLILAVFNMLPVPPLDGARVMAWMMPLSLREPYLRFETFGLLIVIVLIRMVDGVWPMLLQTTQALHAAIERVVTFGGVW